MEPIVNKEKRGCKQVTRKTSGGNTSHEPYISPENKDCFDGVSLGSDTSYRSVPTPVVTCPVMDIEQKRVFVHVDGSRTGSSVVETSSDLVRPPTVWKGDDRSPVSFGSLTCRRLGDLNDGQRPTENPRLVRVTTETLTKVGDRNGDPEKGGGKEYQRLGERGRGDGEMYDSGK